MTSDRSSTPGEWPCMVRVADSISADMSVMAQRSVREKVVIARSSCDEAIQFLFRVFWIASLALAMTRVERPSSHMMVVGILADVADVEDDRLGAQIFPPV